MNAGGENVSENSGKFKEDVHKLIHEEYPLKLNEGHQNKHIIGSSNFDPQRSTLTADPIELIKLYAGKSKPIPTKAGMWSEKERFTHTSEIGIWRDTNRGKEASTNKGILRYSKKNGVHVVPSDPNYRRSEER